MFKKLSIFLLCCIAIVLCAACGTSENSSEKAYTVEIDGKTYRADSQEEIDQIINEHIFGDGNVVLDSYNYIDTDKTESPMIEIESGEYLGISSGNYVEFYFKVRNKSDIPIHIVTINVDILDESGDIVETTHPQESSTLQPGQGIIIDCIVNNNRSGTSAIVSSYSLYTLDGAFATGTIDESPKILFEDVARSVNAEVQSTAEKITDIRLGYAEAARLFESEFNNFATLPDSLMDVLQYYNDTEFTTIDDIRKTESMWQDLATQAQNIQISLTGKQPPIEYEAEWFAFSDCMGKIAKSFLKGTNLDPNNDGEYTGEEMGALITEIKNEFVEYGTEASDLTNEIKAISETIEANFLPEASNIANSSENSGSHTCTVCGVETNLFYKNPILGTTEYYCEPHHKHIVEIMNSMMDHNVAQPSQSTQSSSSDHLCTECGKSANRTYKNPFSGAIEHYCETHYQEIIAIMGMMESDVGRSKQSKHTCEQCGREGTHKYNSFTGQIEYYCTQHYEELMDMLEAFGLE